MISMTISCMSVARYRYVGPLLDPHAPQLPVKPGKTRQIVAKETADAHVGSGNINGRLAFLRPDAVRFLQGAEGEGLAQVKLGQPNSIRKPDAGVSQMEPHSLTGAYSDGGSQVLW